MITSTTTLQELYSLAIAASAMVQPEETFIVRDLFTGLEWKRIPRGLRIKLGAMFLLYVEGQNPNAFETVGKTPQNQQIYRRIR